MTEKKITIAGHEVGVKYCFATEIGFRDLAGVTLDNFDISNPSQTAALIMAAIIAYYQSRNEDAPVEISSIIYECKPKEIVEALNTVYTMRASWYMGDDEARENIPEEEEEKGEQAKNA